MSNTGALIFGAVLLLANAFFVGAEFALISARRSSIEPLAEAGSRRARIALGAMERVSVVMAAAQLGITLCSLGIGALAEPAVAHLIESPLHSLGISEGLQHPIAFVIALAVVVALHVVLGEMVPKNLALAGPVRATIILTPVLVALVSLLRPVVGGLNALANLSLRLFRVTPQDEVASAYTRDEVAGLIEESHREGLLDDDEHDLLTGALSIETVTVGAVLIGLEEWIVVDADVTPRAVEELVARTGFSRFPLRDGGGSVSRYLHVKDVLSIDPAVRDVAVPAKRLRPLIAFRSDESLRSVLGRMTRNGAHLARVIDGSGETTGLVALEDVLARLVGHRSV